MSGVPEAPDEGRTHKRFRKQGPPTPPPPEKDPGVPIKECGFDRKKKRPEKAGRRQSNEFMDKLEDAGFRKELAQIVIDSKGNANAKRVITFLEEMLGEKLDGWPNERAAEDLTNDELVKILKTLRDLSRSDIIQWRRMRSVLVINEEGEVTETGQNIYDENLYGATIKGVFVQLQWYPYSGYPYSGPKPHFILYMNDLAWDIKEGCLFKRSEEHKLAVAIWDEIKRQKRQKRAVEEQDKDNRAKTLLSRLFN